ncbi:MAG: DNA-3-methyladenine glycosylase [Gemmatimonadaceae bacterium]
MTSSVLPRASRAPLEKALPASFYDREADLVARDLLGTILEYRSNRGTMTGRIVEVEAYMGPHDPACHAAAGLTQRTRPLFGPPGSTYVYFVYGNHWCVNAVTREAGYGAAVLIRAVEPLEGVALMRRRRPTVRDDRDLTNGPGKLCAALGIDAGQNATSLQTGVLRILPGSPVEDTLVRVSPRVGITKAADQMLRFFVADSLYVSRVPSSISARAVSI